MNRLFVIFANLLLIFASAVVALADLAPASGKPTPSPPKWLMSTGFAIVPDKKTDQARLEISQETLNELRASLASLPVDAATGNTDDRSLLGSVSGNSGRTIVAGFFLFLSLSFGGVWLARGARAGGHRIAAAVLLGVAVIGAAALITRGNVGPPPSYRWRNLSKNLNDGKVTQGGVDIQVVPEGKGIRLIIPTSASSGADRRSDNE